MQSYGKYSTEQQESLKARNASLIGTVRHYDEIVSHGRKSTIVKGFVADRTFEQAFKKEYYQIVDGSAWGLEDLEIVNLAMRFKNSDDSPGMRTDWTQEPCPPGYHLPKWEQQKNEEFEPIVPVVVKGGS